MELDETTGLVHLKGLLLQQIEIQEKVNNRYAKILRRISYISLALSISILGGIFFIIYSINRPESRINALIEEVNGFEIRTSLLRDYIDEDKNELDSIHNLIDSMKIKIK